MGDLGRELREVLTDTRRGLPSDLVPLDRVYAGARRRRRRRRRTVAAAGALALAAVGVPLALTLPGDTDSAPPARDRPEVAPPWDDARPISFTSADPGTLVVLGQVPRPCRTGCLRMVGSVDGAGTFVSLAVPEAAQRVDRIEGPLTDTVSGVHFANASDGWLFGDGLWSTHDGGNTWDGQSIGGVSQVQTANGTAWALVTARRDGPARLHSSPVGTDEWQPVDGVAVGMQADLAVQGDRVVVIGAGETGGFVGGASGFTAVRGPCVGAPVVRLSAADSTFWATCMTGNLAYLATSTDGVSWRAVTPDREPAQVPNSVSVGARTATEAVIAASPDEPLTRLAADGTTTPLAHPPAGGNAVGISFTTADVGHAVVGRQLWRTDDGAQSWRRVDLP